MAVVMLCPAPADKTRVFHGVWYNPIMAIKNQTSKRPIVSKTFIIMLALVFILPIGIFGAFAGQCKVRQFDVKHSKQSQINTFQELKLTSTDTTPANVYLGGDCVDSSPYVQVDKRIVSSKNAAETLTDIRQTLSSEKYTLSDEGIYKRVGIGNVACGYRYEATATGNSISFKLGFTTYDSQKLPQACRATGEVKVTESDLGNEPANPLIARLN